MSLAIPIPADHKDLIHDVALDYYGRRMATCSSDQSVKVQFPTDLREICIIFPISVSDLGFARGWPMEMHGKLEGKIIY